MTESCNQFRQVLSRLFHENKRRLPHWGENHPAPLIQCNSEEIEIAYAELYCDGNFPDYSLDDLINRFWGEYHNYRHFLDWKGNKIRMIQEGIPGLKGINNDAVMATTILWDNFHFIGASFSRWDIQNHLPDVPPIYKARTILAFRK